MTLETPLDEIGLWERFEDEPSLWFDRFERYRLAGPRRKMLAIYNAERAREDLAPLNDVPGSWKQAAKDWDWKNRASTWDASEHQRRREEYDAEREEDHHARVMLLKVARSKLVQGLNALHPEQLKPGELLNGIRMVVQELRAEYDDLPIQRLDLEALTDDELRAITSGAGRR